MTHFFLDSSALAKRYLVEIGSTWVIGVTNPAAGHTIVVAEITRVEVAAALAARHRAPSGISRKERNDAVNLLLRHFNSEYQLVSVTPESIGRAVTLTQNHRLRGYDAIQLATALDANTSLRATGLAGLTFVAADDDLVTAARAEGLPIINPNRHP